MPDFDGAVLGTGDNDGQRRVEDGERDVSRVSLQRLNARLVLVVPDLDGAIIARGHDIRPVSAVIIFDIVDSLFVCFQTVVCDG